MESELPLYSTYTKPRSFSVLASGCHIIIQFNTPILSNCVPCCSFSWPGVVRVPWVISYGTKLNMSELGPALAPLRESLFHLLMNVPKGVPQGAPLHPSLGGVKPLSSCWGATSWRGPPTSSWASHAPLLWTGGLHSSPLISFFSFLSCYLSFIPPNARSCSPERRRPGMTGPCR